MTPTHKTTAELRKSARTKLFKMNPTDRERLLELEAKRRGLPLPTKPQTKKD